MSLTITIRHAPGENVMITELNVQGRIEAVILRPGAVVEYDVAYWWNGVRSVAALKEEDIRGK